MKGPFLPRYFFASVLLLLILASAYVFSESRRFRQELLHQTEAKAEALAEAMETSAKNAILGNSLLENLIAERLFDNARLIDRLLLTRPLDQTQLSQISALNRLQKVELLDREGRPWEFQESPMQKRMREMMRKGWGRQTDIEHIALFDSNLKIVAHTDPTQVGQQENDPLVLKVKAEGQPLSRTVEATGGKGYYEAIKPLSLDKSPLGVLKIRLSLEPMEIAWRNSLRAGAPLVRVNCAALPETLLEPELFGHEKGAFTGALTKREGRFELADRGSLFLDEIGDPPLPLQAKLLRVLQEREFERVGSSVPIRVNVRILAATHRDLEELLKTGQFREDLYYRLNVVTILLPPLRERRQDLPFLIDHFLKLFAGKNRKTIRGFTQDAREALLRYDYPGNVRELENIIERAVVLTRDDLIGKADLPLSIHEPEAETNEESTLPAATEGMERRMIREALARSGGIQTRAAELLGISERALRYKLKKYGLRGEDSGS